MIINNGLVNFVIEFVAGIDNVSRAGGFDIDWRSPNKIGVFVVNAQTSAGDMIVMSNGWKQRVIDSVSIKIVSTGTACENIWQVQEDIRKTLPGEHLSTGKGLFSYNSGRIEVFSPERIELVDKYDFTWWLTHG
jgi:hypothetical protein